MPRFDLEQFLGLLQKHRVTTAYLVPAIVLALAKHPLVDKFDISSLKNIMSGAAPLPESLARGVEALGSMVRPRPQDCPPPRTILPLRRYKSRSGGREALLVSGLGTWRESCLQVVDSEADRHLATADYPCSDRKGAR